MQHNRLLDGFSTPYSVPARYITNVGREEILVSQRLSEVLFALSFLFWVLQGRCNIEDQFALSLRENSGGL